jgi:hypothetical protein
MLHFRLLTLVAALAITGSPSFAGFVQYSQPDGAYQAATTYLDTSYVTDATSVNLVTDGTLTIGFSSPLVKTTSWTWSATPNSQYGLGATVPVLEGYSLGPTLTLTLTFSSPLFTFGVEVEPEPFELHDITVGFYNGASLVGSITRNVDGEAGARLFAASADPFSHVIISSETDFGLSGFRYTLDSGGSGVPEPATFALFGAGFAVLALARRRSTQS